MRNQWIRFGKILFIGTCFWIIATAVDFSDILSAYEKSRFIYIVFALILLLADAFLLAHRCGILLMTKQIRFRYISLLRVVFVSNFLSIAIPSSLGADVIRIVMLREENCPLHHATSVMVMDKVLSVLSMVVLALPGLFLIRGVLPDGRIPFLLIVFSLVTMLCTVLAVSRLPSTMLRWIEIFLRGALDNASALIRTVLLFFHKGLQISVDVHQSFYDFRSRPRVLAASFGWHLLNQVFRVLQVHFLFLALNESVPLVILFAYVPIIFLLTLLPVSYFGLGVREGAFLLFFTKYGIPAEVCLAVSFLSYLLILAGMIPGGLLIFWQKTLGRRDTVR